VQSAVLAAALLLLAPGLAAAADAAVSLELPAGQSKNIRLRNLPLGTVLAIRIVASGKLLVALVSQKELKSSERAPKPLFRGALERKLSFRVVIPEPGDYYLVLNNRNGAEMLEVQTDIRAEPVRRRPGYSPLPEKASWSPRESSMPSSARRVLECPASARRCASQYSSLPVRSGTRSSLVSPAARTAA
jgi:hypothetical protein